LPELARVANPSLSSGLGSDRRAMLEIIYHI
jgi:hypothetical protein